MLKVNNISSGYGEVTVIHGLSFEVGNEVFAVLGANGVGKSTLMKTIAGVLPLKSGEIYYKNTNISHDTSYQTSMRGLAFVPQEDLIFRKMSVMENLSIGGMRLDKKLKKEKLEEVFDLFPALRDRISQRAGSLSGGEAQMLAVGRALMQDPEMILLDEPTSGLSPKYVDIFFNKVTEIRQKKGVSVIISEQNAAKALDIADKIMVLTLGKTFLIDEAKNVTIDRIKEGYRI